MCCESLFVNFWLYLNHLELRKDVNEHNIENQNQPPVQYKQKTLTY